MKKLHQCCKTYKPIKGLNNVRLTSTGIHISHSLCKYFITTDRLFSTGSDTQLLPRPRLYCRRPSITTITITTTKANFLFSLSFYPNKCLYRFLIVFWIQLKKHNSPVLYRGRAGRNTWPSLMAADAKIAVAIVEAVIVVVIIEPVAKTRRTNEPPTQTQTQICQLMKWRRQVVAIAAEVEVYCGSNLLPWSNFDQLGTIASGMVDLW